MKKNELTAVNNKIILARASFTVPQKRIIAGIIDTISPNLNNQISRAKGKEIIIPDEDFSLSKIQFKASDLSRPEDYGELRKALKELNERKVEIETQNGWIGSGFLSEYEFDKHSETVLLLINKKFYNLLLDYNKEIGYTQYMTSVLISFSSIYAMRMYEIIAKWRNKPMFPITVDELRRLTDTQKKYPQIFDFKKYVLDIAKKQLDESNITDLKFDYTDKKDGRNIVGFNITIHKTDHAHEVQKQRNQESHYWTIKDKQVLDKLKELGVSVKGKNLDLVKRIIELVGEVKLYAKILEIVETAKIKDNPPKYVVGSLKKYLEHIENMPSVVQNTEKEYWEVNMTKEQRKQAIEKKRKEEDAKYSGQVDFNKLANELKK